jgi:hypothetical protein
MKQTIKLPDSWADVSMKQFQELESVESIVDKIAILSDEDPELIKKMDVASYNKVAEALSWVQNLPEEKEGEETIIIDERKYNAVKLSSLSLGNWVDLEHYLKEPINNLHKIMAILYLPEGEETYNSKTAIERSELFLEKMSVNDAYGTLVFFSLIEKRSLEAIRDYFQMKILEMEVKETLKQKQRESKEKRKKRKLINGLGFSSVITWLKGILQRWKV